MQGHAIEPSDLSIQDIHQIISSNSKIYLSDKSKALITKGRNYLEKTLANSDSPIYGINTDFGSLCDVEIKKNELEQLQENLVLSHA
ncbi:MAG: aromatic amino acid lyase, partial [Bacteroidia bacterium]